MSRRLEIELTSERPDGTWTWRAAGAKQPKGDLVATVLPDGAKVGDVLRADAEFAVDGIEIVSVLPPKSARKEPERLVVVGTQKDEPLVTTQLAPKGRGGRDRGDRGDRGDRRDRGDRGDRRGGPRSDRDGQGPRRERSDRPRGPRPDPVPERPKPKRLRPGRAHRAAILDELAVEERPIAEQVLRGGVPAVREAIAKQNEQARTENRPEIPSEQLVALAERLLPKLRAAEWRDKADAALSDLDELDLRDLRSVVVAADGNTRDDESRALLVQLQEGLTRRVEQEHTNWVEDMTANLDAGRFVRALRLSSRPPKAGTPLPPELATRLIAAVSEGLTPTVNQDLWAAALDALAFSPVRNQVVPAGRPETPSEGLLEAVMRVGDRLPKIVELFGLDPAEVAKAAKRRPRGGARGRNQKPGAKGAAKDGGNRGAKGEKDAGTKDAKSADTTSGDTNSDETTAGATEPATAESASPNDAGATAQQAEGSLAAGAHATEDEQVRDAAGAEESLAAAEASDTPESTDTSDSADTPESAGAPQATEASDDAAPAVEETPAADPGDAAGGGDISAGMSSGPADAPMSETETVAVPVEADAATGDAPSVVEVPAAAEAAVAESAATSSDDAAPGDETASAPDAAPADESTPADSGPSAGAAPADQGTQTDGPDETPAG